MKTLLLIVLLALLKQERPLVSSFDSVHSKMQPTIFAFVMKYKSFKQN